MTTKMVNLLLKTLMVLGHELFGLVLPLTIHVYKPTPYPV